MRWSNIALSAVTAFVFFSGTACSQAGFDNFVTRQDDKLMDGDKELRFISFNIPNLHYIEDNVPFEQTNSWRLPNEFEITDALTSIKQMAGQVTRTYTLSVKKQGEDSAIPRHILGPGKFNEDAFRALDKVLEVANKSGVRVIIPFVDNWVWWGGIKEYADFRGKSKEQFWTDPQLIEDFKKTVDYLINRTNTYTGVKYKDDKAILAWETGNELVCPHSWTHEIAAYIKSFDSNHLVVDGYHTKILRQDSIDDPSIDIVVSHNYSSGRSLINEVKQCRKIARGKKPYIVGEFGFVKTSEVEELLDTLINEGASGAMIWSLRFRSRNGGFYWHSEPHGADLYKAYHWPGFASGDAYDERNLLALMRNKAFKIQGKDTPKLDTPAPPKLLPIVDVSAISWQGSAGADSYIVERSQKAKGPWRLAGSDISDAATPYMPLFNDTNVTIGKQYYYRVKAKNIAGISKPSNTVGPVRVSHLTLVDEMKDLSKMSTKSGVSPTMGDTRKSKEDMDRIKGKAGDFVVYELPKPVTSIKVYAFIPGRIVDFKFSISSDGKQFDPIKVMQRGFFKGEGAYGYWKPVLYQSRPMSSNSQFLKIEFAAEAQISRVEIAYGGSEATMNKQEITSFLDSTRDELTHNILSFWTKHCQDNLHGGFIGRMTNDNKVIEDAPKGLVLNARILWTYSASYRFDKNPKYLELADRAYGYLMKYFWDSEHGGAFWMLDAQGKPTDDSKEMYGQSFVIYALAEYYLATGNQDALNKAKELFGLIEKHCHDDANTGYFETISRDWSQAEKARLATGDTSEKKTMNTHLHMLEAYTNLYRAWKDQKVKARLEELINIFTDHIIDQETFHFKLFFDEKWNSTKPVVSYGHDIEGSWLLCEAAEVLGDENVIEKIKPVALKIAQAVYERGFDTDGGLFYEAEHGKITIAEKHWWPQAETVVGFINAYQLSGKEYFLGAALECWQFIKRETVDHEHGEWFSLALEKGREASAWKASEWKAPYHNGRACIESVRRLEEIIEQSH